MNETLNYNGLRHWLGPLMAALGLAGGLIGVYVNLQIHTAEMKVRQDQFDKRFDHQEQQLGQRLDEHKQQLNRMEDKIDRMAGVQPHAKP